MIPLLALSFLAHAGEAVLVSQNAWLCADAELTRHCFRHVADDGALEPWRVDAYQLVARKGAVLELRSARLGQPSHCESSPDPIAALGLRLYTDAAEAVDVTRRAIDLDYGEGQRLHVDPGVPVAWTGKGWTLDLRHLSASVSLPDAAVGQSYSPVKKTVRNKVMSEDLDYIDRGATFTIGGKAVRFAPSSELDVPVYSRVAQGQAERVSIRTCGVELEGLVPSSALREGEEAHWQTGPGKPRPQGATVIRKGAAIYWPAGDRAGTAAVDLRTDVDFAAEHGRMCGAFVLGHGNDGSVADRALKLCVDAADLKTR
jgi:hypothetical protein